MPACCQCLQFVSACKWLAPEKCWHLQSVNACNLSAPAKCGHPQVVGTCKVWAPANCWHLQVASTFKMWLTASCWQLQVVVACKLSVPAVCQCLQVVGTCKVSAPAKCECLQFVGTCKVWAPANCCHFDVLTMSPSLFHDNGIPAPFLHSAKSSDPDLLTHKQAMNNPDHTEWVLAMQKEITELKGKDTWVKVPKSEAATNILPSLWLFKCKHSPDGDIQKFKARFCIQG